VRPIFTIDLNCSAFLASVSRSFATDGRRCLVTATVAATDIAVGKTSFDDCPLLTSSLG